MELHHADPQIGLVELVADVPANGAELAALLDQRVEEAESVEESLEIQTLLTTLVPLRVADGVAQVRPHDVRP